MSEQPYTPSTVEVRNAYRLSDQDLDGSPYLPEKSDAEFDRWLAGVKAEAWAEGYRAGSQDMSDLRAGRLTFQTITTNPYGSAP